VRQHWRTEIRVEAKRPLRSGWPDEKDSKTKPKGGAAKAGLYGPKAAARANGNIASSPTAVELDTMLSFEGLSVLKDEALLEEEDDDDEDDEMVEFDPRDFEDLDLESINDRLADSDMEDELVGDDDEEDDEDGEEAGGVAVRKNPKALDKGSAQLPRKVKRPAVGVPGTYF